MVGNGGVISFGSKKNYRGGSCPQYFTVPHLYVRNPWNLADSMDFRGPFRGTFVKNEIEA